MKPLAFALLLITCSALAPAQAAGRPSPVARLAARYLDGLFRAKPHLATFMGEHRFDARLPDWSEAALRRREGELESQRRALEALSVHPQRLSRDEAIDVEILRDGIALELLYLREIKDWSWDPRLHDSFPYYDPRELIAGRLSDIIHGDFAPETARRRSVTAQLSGLPRLLGQARAALLEALQRPGARRTPRVYAEQAIKGNRGRLAFFETELKAFTEKDRRAEAARARALEALRGHQRFLEEELLPRADGDWRLGASLYAKKFPLALQTALTPAEALPRAEAAFSLARGELYAVARRLHRELWPKAAVPPERADRATQAQLIAKVKDQLGKDHPAPGELVAAHGRNLDQMRAFITQHGLLALPPSASLVVDAMPGFKRGAAAAEYLAPGILDRRPAWHATYYVDPIDPAWPAERVESYLRGQNDYEVQLIAMHEAYPGHHTQYFYSKRNLNPLRAALWNAPMVEGWAVYGEGLMVELGWGGPRNDRYRFYDLRGQMISATNLILDVKLQSGAMSDEEAVRFMVEEGFQEPAMADKKLLRAKLDSTQLAQYFLGLDEIEGLELAYRKQVGPAFSQRAFNEALIGQGSIAVKFLRRYVLGEPHATP